MVDGSQSSETGPCLTAGGSVSTWPPISASCGTFRCYGMRRAACCFSIPPTPGPEQLYAQLSARFEWYHPRSKREFDIARSHIKSSDGCARNWWALATFVSGLCASPTRDLKRTAPRYSLRVAGGSNCIVGYELLDGQSVRLRSNSGVKVTSTAHNWALNGRLLISLVTQ